MRGEFTEQTVTATDLRTGDTILRDGCAWRVTVRKVDSGSVLVSGLTADNCGWFRSVVEPGREFVRLS